MNQNLSTTCSHTAPVGYREYPVNNPVDNISFAVVDNSCADTSFSQPYHYRACPGGAKIAELSDNGSFSESFPFTSAIEDLTQRRNQSIESIDKVRDKVRDKDMAHGDGGRKLCQDSNILTDTNTNKMPENAQSSSEAPSSPTPPSWHWHLAGALCSVPAGAPDGQRGAAAFSHQSSVISHQSSVTSYQSPITDHPSVESCSDLTTETTEENPQLSAFTPQPLINS